MSCGANDPAPRRPLYRLSTSSLFTVSYVTRSKLDTILPYSKQICEDYVAFHSVSNEG